MCAKIFAFVLFISAAVLPFWAHSQTPKIQNIPPYVRSHYIAQYKITQVRTHPDGKTNTEETTEVLAVDSLGRTMTATTLASHPGEQTKTLFTVVDPIAQSITRWSSPGTVASVSALPQGAPHGCSSFGVAGMENLNEKAVTEDMGTTKILGIQARGQRTSKTVPLDSSGRNLKLLNMVEEWTAVDPGLKKLLVRYVEDDRTTGKNTSKELVSLRQSEPPLKVFRVPAGYRRQVSPLDCSVTADEVPIPPLIR